MHQSGPPDQSRAGGPGRPCSPALEGGPSKLAWAGTSLAERVEDRWDELQETLTPSCPYSIRFQYLS